MPADVTAGQPQARRPLLAGIVLIVAVDQFTKWLVERSLALHQSVEVVPGLLNLTHVRNTGAAFGVLNAADFPYKPVVVACVAVLALAAIAYYAAKFGQDTALGRTAMMLVLGGAVGNLVDRALRGYVVDFVDAYWRGWHFWAFNVADAAITVGAIFLILDTLGVARRVSSAV
ncbi:MAG: signal peptidase II [Vicinamibacteraceae bacterium]|nr:signal peptidase II [Vicinamibacteraceae bacterium]